MPLHSRTARAASSSLGSKQHGVQTHIPKSTSFDLCSEATLDGQQYLSLIKEYVYPAIEGLTVWWTPVNQERTQGLGMIEVPPQNPERQYFLIANAVDAGSRIKQFVFGIVRELPRGDGECAAPALCLCKPLHRPSDQRGGRRTIRVFRKLLEITSVSVGFSSCSDFLTHCTAPLGR